MADIEFANDIALFANYAIDAQTLLQTVEEIAASVGLIMNETKYMAEGNIEGNITSLNGENIEKVEDFVYLDFKIRASELDIGQPSISLNKSGNLTLEKLLRLDSLLP